MEKLTLKTKEIVNERFGKDNIIALATLKDGKPYVRNVDDENTCILCIRLTDGILFANGTRYDIDFTD